MNSFQRYQPLLRNWITQQRWQLRDEQQQQLLQHLQLLQQWHTLFNLTAIAEAHWFEHHLLDSLSLYPIINASKVAHIADIGSGAGFPGVPLAICFKHIDVTLVEVNQKKCRFLKQVAIDLQLTNLSIACTRVEALQQPFDVVCTRATFQPQWLVPRCLPLVKPHGQLMAMLSEAQYQQQQNHCSDNQLEPWHYQPLTVPQTLGRRYVAMLQQR